jgi:hypothetical protein
MAPMNTNSTRRVTTATPPDRSQFLRNFRDRELPHVKRFLDYGLQTGSSAFQCLDRALNAAAIALADPETDEVRRIAARCFRDLCLHKPSAAERFIKACIEGVVDARSFEGGRR